MQPSQLLVSHIHIPLSTAILGAARSRSCIPDDSRTTTTRRACSSNNKNNNITCHGGDHGKPRGFDGPDAIFTIAASTPTATVVQRSTIAEPLLLGWYPTPPYL